MDEEEGFFLGDDEEGFFLEDEEEGFFLGDDEEGFFLGDDEEGFFLEENEKINLNTNQNKEENLEDLNKATKVKEIKTEEEGPENEVGNIASVLAGIGSGLISIPKGLFSLGATLTDLGSDTDNAAKVEKWFDDLTVLDEMAEAI